MPKGIARQANIRRTVWCVLAAAAIAGGRAWSAPPAVQAEPTEIWQVIYLGEQRVGYSHTTVTTLTRDRKPLVRTQSEDHMKIKRFGDTLNMQVNLTVEERPNGDMLSFTLETHNPPAESSKTVGTVEGNWLRLERTVAGRTSRDQIEWKPGTKSPVYQDRLLRERPLLPGERRKMDAFEPAFDKVTGLRLIAGEVRRVELLDGKEENLLRVEVVKSVLPQIKTRAFLTPQGEARKIETGLMDMVVYTVPKETALEAIAGAELDLAVNTLVQVDPIRGAHDKQRIVYRVTTPGDNASKFFAEGDTQQVRKVDDETAELTVTALRPERSIRNRPVDDEYLRESRYLQSNDRHVIEHATRAAGGRTQPIEIALEMERYVSEKLTEKGFSTALASAAEVARDLEGDCTEHAVLLAAMLRAKRIPSRIAVGLVYIESRSAFGGHMWTEAYLGEKWVPLDATRGQGGIGPAHIKLAHSSFADDAPPPVLTFVPLLQVLDKMRIEVVSVE